jgi:hypothetical protein
VFLNPSDSYFLFANFVDFYTHLTYICICTCFVTFFSAIIDGQGGRYIVHLSIIKVSNVSSFIHILSGLNTLLAILNNRSTGADLEEAGTDKYFVANLASDVSHSSPMAM